MGRRVYKGLDDRIFVLSLHSVFKFFTDWPWGSLVFFAAIWSHVVSGVVAVVYPPKTRNEAAGIHIPKSATCLKVTRHADFSTVEVAIGQPAVELSALLRLDGVKYANSTDSATRFFSQEVVESKTVECSLTGSCNDVMYLADGTRTSLELKYGKFAYRHGVLERSLYTTSSQIGGVSGEFFLREGYNYFVTATHVCYSSEDVQSSGVPVRIEGGTLKANKADLAYDSLLKSTPAGQHLGKSCNSTEVSLFPELSSLESTWLSVADAGLYGSDPDIIEARRIIAEIGVECAKNQATLLRNLKLYELDCLPYSSCRYTASVPFRRFSTSSIFLSLKQPGYYYVRTAHDDTLLNIPRLANSTNAFYSSLLKMIMITLAAAVVYVRSRKKTASSSWLFKNCISISRRNGPLGKSQSEENYFEDIYVGLLAIIGRIVVVVVRLSSLLQDDQFRVCVSEFIGAGLSTIHFLVRYGALVTDHEESPITKLGGSTAIVDSTAAVMLAFSETPTFATSSSSFNSTARMLVALLISIIVVTRCVFSAACCGILWPTFAQDGRRDYAYILMYSAAAWCAQSAILAITSCDLFVSPAAYSMSRSMAGNVSAMFYIRLVLFLCMTASGLPRLIATTRHILSDKEHVD